MTYAAIVPTYFNKAERQAITVGSCCLPLLILWFLLLLQVTDTVTGLMKVIIVAIVYVMDKKVRGLI